MNDLISRQAAIDIVRNRVKKYTTPCVLAVTDIQQLPSAQPEIIRCKDCKDYQTDWETSYPNRHYCATMDSMMHEDGFCSYAERRTDGSD